MTLQSMRSYSSNNDLHDEQEVCFKILHLNLNRLPSFLFRTSLSKVNQTKNRLGCIGVKNQAIAIKVTPPNRKLLTSSQKYPSINKKLEQSTLAEIMRVQL